MKYRVESKVVGYIFSIDFFLQNAAIGLSYDGDNTYLSTDLLDVPDDQLHVVARVVGMNGADWSVTVHATRPGDNVYKGVTRKVDRTIRAQQTDLYQDTVDLTKEDK